MRVSKENKERVVPDEALKQLFSLLTKKWGLASADYILVDELAYVLQGYEVRGPEMAGGHVDVYVNPKPLPWPDKGERSIIPPKDSRYIDDWVSYMAQTGYSLDMLRARPEFLKTPSIEYFVGTDEIVRLMRAFEMTELFVQQTILHYSLADVGPEKIKEWLDKLELIEQAAQKKRDIRLAELCSNKLKEGGAKWRGVVT